MKILFVSSEVAPFAKTGGLADVAGSLPQAIKDKGHDIRVVMPEYKKIAAKYKDQFEHVLHFRTNVVWRNEYVGINKLKHGEVPIYFVDNKNYFNRGSMYESKDKDVQFAFFARAILEFLPKIDFKPDVIHCNDWQTGPVSIMLDDNYRQYEFYRDIKTVFTIHNLRYQGQFSPRTLYDVLGIDEKHWFTGKIRHNGLVNYMKMGIMYADIITTVSKTYAREIKTEYFGEGLDYALRLRGDDLFGIVNGISYKQFDPRTDENIYYNYSHENLENKYKNKEALQQEMDLPVDRDIPVISIVSRLVEQKGLDLIEEVITELMESDIQFVLLGTGQAKYEDFFRQQAEEYPQKIAASIKYDFGLAQKIYAGSDMFLMPSRYEPCGLGQLISMRYGTLPVVKETGGLNDTVIPYNTETDEGYGFSFTDVNSHDMLYTLRRAIYFYKQSDTWIKLVKRAMNQDFSWKYSAQEYIDLYNKIVEKNKQHTSKNGKSIQIEENNTNPEADNVITEQKKSKNAADCKDEPELKNIKKISKEEKKKLININTANIKELQKLTGIGSTYAARIISYREKKGDFREIEKIKNIKGISIRRYSKIKDKIKVR